MTQAEKDKIIKDLQEKLAEAEKIKVDDSKRWQPQDGETFWYVGYDGTVYNSDFGFDYEWLYLTGNCFKTKEEAEEYKKQIEYTARYKNYIEEHTEPIDWKDDNQPKHFSFLDTYYNEIHINYASIVKRQGAIYASNEQIIIDAIKEIGEDNFKKYVVGVE